MEVNWKHVQRAYKLHVEPHNELEYEFHSSTSWCGAVNQGRRNKMHVPKCASQPPDKSALALPVWKGCPSTLGNTPL